MSASKPPPEAGSVATAFSEEHYRTLFESIDQGFCTVEVLFDENGTASDYRFLDVNPAFVHQTGLHNALGRRMRELAPAHEEHWFRIYGQVALTGEPVRFEHSATALGRLYDVYAFRVDEPAQRRVAILFNDITARKEAERALDAARQEAERANRAKDEFLAMLGHELRNPLAPMLTALQLMRLRGHASREQDVLERQVKHLQLMVDDLLDVSRITRGKIELHRRHVELGEVVLRAMELTGPLLEQRQNHVDVRVPRRGAGIDADLARMAQVISNLLTNAARYSAPRSRIVIRGERDGDVVRLTVSDEGIGIPGEMLGSIFEAFVQQPQSVERGAGGLGLGLAIVRSLVAAHGGTVRVNSEGVNRGSDFIVELPAVDVVADVAEDGRSARPDRVVSSSRKILVVDDNEDAAHMMRDALEQFGYDVEVAFDGPSALARARSFRPDTVVLDIGLPVMDGYEVARKLRSMEGGEQIRLLAVTGYGQPADRRSALEAGFERHLVKPVDLERLGRLISKPRPTS